MRRRNSVVWAAAAVSVGLAATLTAWSVPAAAAPNLDDGRQAWVQGQRVTAFAGCWSTDRQPILLEARTRQGWVTVDRGTAVRDAEQCPRSAYPWAVTFTFRLDESGTGAVPGSTARLLELRTRGEQGGRTYFTDKLVYPTRTACRAELRDWQCA